MVGELIKSNRAHGERRGRRRYRRNTWDMDNLFQHFTCVVVVLPATHKLNVGGYPLLNGGLSSSVSTKNIATGKFVKSDFPMYASDNLQLSPIKDL